MKLGDLARQMRVNIDDLLNFAGRIGIDVVDANSVLASDDEWNIRKEWEQGPRDAGVSALAERFGVRQMRPRMVPAGPGGQRRSTKRAEPSDFAKLFLERDESFVKGFYNPPPFHVRVEQAEAQGREWAREMFTAAEARAWVELNGDISPKLAAELRAAGMSAEDAAVRIRTARGYVERLPLSTRVSCGELTAEQAVAELRAMRDQ